MLKIDPSRTKSTQNHHHICCRNCCTEKTFTYIEGEDFEENDWDVDQSASD